MSDYAERVNRVASDPERTERRKAITPAFTVPRGKAAADVRRTIVAFLEESGGAYDLRYSTSIGKLADDLLKELR